MMNAKPKCLNMAPLSLPCGLELVLASKIAGTFKVELHNGVFLSFEIFNGWFFGEEGESLAAGTAGRRI